MSKQNSIPAALADQLRVESLMDRYTDSDSIILFRTYDGDGETNGWLVQYSCLNSKVRAVFWYSKEDLSTAIAHYNQD